MDLVVKPIQQIIDRTLDYDKFKLVTEQGSILVLCQYIHSKTTTPSTIILTLQV